MTFGRRGVIFAAEEIGELGLFGAFRGFDAGRPRCRGGDHGGHVLLRCDGVESPRSPTRKGRARAPERPRQFSRSAIHGPGCCAHAPSLRSSSRRSQCPPAPPLDCCRFQVPSIISSQSGPLISICGPEPLSRSPRTRTLLPNSPCSGRPALSKALPFSLVTTTAEVHAAPRSEIEIGARPALANAGDTALDNLQRPKSSRKGVGSIGGEHPVRRIGPEAEPGIARRCFRPQERGQAGARRRRRADPRRAGRDDHCRDVGRRRSGRLPSEERADDPTPTVRRLDRGGPENHRAHEPGGQRLTAMLAELRIIARRGRRIDAGRPHATPVLEQQCETLIDRDDPHAGATLWSASRVPLCAATTREAESDGRMAASKKNSVKTPGIDRRRLIHIILAPAADFRLVDSDCPAIPALTL